MLAVFGDRAVAGSFFSEKYSETPLKVMAISPAE
jgi:hypothetical protein